MKKKGNIETKTAFYYIENNVLFMRGKKDAVIDFDEAKAGVEARKKLQLEKKC